jgi:hypothetical protein
MPSIEELLHRRTDLSTFLVHFTRDTEPASAADNLVSILSGPRIQARTAYGMARTLAERFPEVAATQKTVCFTETPLEHAWMMNSQIPNRQVHFNGYGIAFTKTFARRWGGNPVWYLDITPSGNDWLTVPVQELRDQAEQAATAPGGDVDAAQLAAAPILQLTPFIEQMGPTRDGRKEFWWEREWRRVGDLGFQPFDIVVVFAPEHEHRAVRERLAATGFYGDIMMPAFVDARWGLERMIGAMAKVPAQDLGPFPS